MLLLLTPGAAAWSVDVRAPERAPEGVPFAIEVCADGEVRVLAENATLDVREDRYGPAGCRAIEVEPEGGVVRVEARVRAGSAIRARAFANVTIDRAPGELRLLEARAPPLAGVIVANVGAEAASLAVRRLDRATLPDVTLAPGGTIFLGPVQPPDAEEFAETAVRVREGTMRLTVGARVESALEVPKLRAGHSTLGRYGRTSVANASFDVAGEILAFATPGATPLPALIGSAREEVLVASHTLTSPDVAAALVEAADRGARVRVLLEGAPPGGVPPAERALVATMKARGVDVLTMGGEGARYRTMHAKLIVVDRAAVAVSTENLNEGRSRGYGLIVRDAALAGSIARVMDEDAAPWHDVRAADFADPPAIALPSLETPGPRASFPGPHRARLVLSPDEPRALAEALASARVSLDVAMLRADPQSPTIDALVAAARAGARVRLLLDARHDDGTNRETAQRLNALGQREGLNVSAKLDRSDRTLHAKAFVLDGTTSYVGSMNWVRPAWEDNREAGVLVDDEALAAWLTHEFEQDWNEKEEEARAEVPAPGWWAVLAALSALRARRGRARDRA